MSEETLTLVFVGMRRKMRQFAARFFSDTSDADDALQEAFCRLWPRRDEFGDAASAEAVAKTTVRNLGIDTYRRKSANPTVALDEAPEADSADTASERAEREAQFRAVERIVDERLTSLQRTVFRMREYEELPFAEIAGRLGMQEAAVRMQLSRARKTIKECYNKTIER